MTENAIETATPEQLRIWIAESLGYPCFTCAEWEDEEACSFFPLNFDVAEGFYPCNAADYKLVMYYEQRHFGKVPNWPDDIGAAWDLIERARADFEHPFLLSVETRASCFIARASWFDSNTEKETTVGVAGDIASEAICRAYLLARANANT